MHRISLGTTVTWSLSKVNSENTKGKDLFDPHPKPKIKGSNAYKTFQEDLDCPVETDVWEHSPTQRSYSHLVSVLFEGSQEPYIHLILSIFPNIWSKSYLPTDKYRVCKSPACPSKSKSNCDILQNLAINYSLLCVCGFCSAEDWTNDFLYPSKFSTMELYPKPQVCNMFLPQL